MPRVPQAGAHAAVPEDAGIAHAADSGAVRFAALWDRCVASPPSSDGATVYADLRSRYSAPFRHFHNLGHIGDCLRLRDEVAHLLVDGDAVEFALWFHDVIYDIGAPTNELRSADLFLTLSAGAPFLFRNCVCDHILATRHLDRVRDDDRRYVVDIDLSGFGAPWEEFMRNGALLREEWSAVPDVNYFSGQYVFLSRLAERRHFFATGYFRDRFEATARENLHRVLADLRAQGYGTASSPIR